MLEYSWRYAGYRTYPFQWCGLEERRREAWDRRDGYPSLASFHMFTCRACWECWGCRSCCWTIRKFKTWGPPRRRRYGSFRIGSCAWGRLIRQPKDWLPGASQLTSSLSTSSRSPIAFAWEGSCSSARRHRSYPSWNLQTATAGSINGGILAIAEMRPRTHRKETGVFCKSEDFPFCTRRFEGGYLWHSTKSLNFNIFELTLCCRIQFPVFLADSSSFWFHSHWSPTH